VIGQAHGVNGVASRTASSTSSARVDDGSRSRAGASRQVLVCSTRRRRVTSLAMEDRVVATRD
jgi:hypothetical protein